MRTQEYKDYDKPTGYCIHCNTERPKNMFSPSHLYKTGNGSCKICDWIKKKKGIPIYGTFSEKEMYIIISSLFLNKVTIVNDLADEMNKNVDDIIRAIQFLKIGNKEFIYRYHCEYCGKEGFVNPQKYFLNKYFYCSRECYWRDKPSKAPKGEDCFNYNQVIVNCSNCNKEFSVIKSRTERTNRFGETNIFCSSKCYWEFISKSYCGDRHVHFKHTDDSKERMRIAVASRLNSMDRLDTEIQLTTNAILQELNIKYQREYAIEFYSIDNYLLDYNLMIEVQGDYWHCNPLIFNADKYLMNQKQYEGIHRDKLKHSYIKNHCNVEILYLWETDIEKRLDVCQALILLYVNNNGVLSNYHSFNYDLVNDELKLREDLIIPYQNMPCNEYKHLVKNPA